MRDQIILAALSGGKSAIGKFVRLWLVLMGLACVGITAAALAWATHYTVVERLIAGVVFTVPLSMPLAVITAIVLIAVKF